MEPDEKDFSWSGLFIVTACCCFLFNVIIKILDGHFSPLLFLVAGVAGFLGLFSVAFKIIDRQVSKKNKKNSVFEKI